MISVIVPVYNREKYLDKCVHSILDQEYGDIELILVDDGSQDASPGMCDAFAEMDSRVKVIHKENGGPGSARNVALDIAKGEFISFIDSDDWIEADMYSSLMELMKNCEADMAVCEVALNQNDGTVVPKRRAEGTLVMTRQEAMDHRFDNSEIITDSLWNKLYKKCIFDSIRFPEDRMLSEDTAVMYRIVDRTDRVVFTEKIGYNVRCNMSSISRSVYKKYRCDTILTFYEMANFVESKEEYKKYVPTVNAYISGAILYNAGEMYGVDFEGKDETKKHIQKCAKELLSSGRILSMKNKMILRLISVAPDIYGMIYKTVKKG